MAEVLLADTNAATATTKAGEASASASTASTQAGISTTKAGESAASAAAALASKNAAATSETNASSSETNALASKNSATTSASTATTQAGIATTQAGISTTKASEAAASAASITGAEANSSASATAAAGSASAASGSATSAANSAASAATALDNFEDKYLGSLASEPTTDLDGNALVSGALYFSQSSSSMQVYDGANWIAASSAGVSSLNLFEYTATASQTTFSGSDDNGSSMSFITGNNIFALNGIILDPSDFNDTSGTSVVLADAAVVGDLLNCYCFKSFTVADTVSASTGGTFAGSVAVTGNISVTGTVDGRDVAADGTELDALGTAADYATAAQGTLAASALQPTGDGSQLTGIGIADGSITQPKLAAEAVNESKLQVSNAPTNGYVLSAQSGNTGGMTWAEAASGYWSNLAEVTLGGSQVSTIDITLPTGYDVLKLDIRFPVCVGSTSRSANMQLLDSNGTVRAFAHQTDLFITNNSPSQQQSRFGSTFVLSPAYGQMSTDYCFYRLEFFDVDSPSIHTKWQGQGSAYVNSNALGANMLSSGFQYSTAHVTSTARFSLSSSATFNTDDGCYYRLYGHSYS